MLALRALLLLCVAQLARGQPAAPPAPPAPPAPSTPPVFRLDRRQLRHLQEDLHKPPTSVRGGLQDVIEELYLENQILDHFNPTDKRTWKQRYFRRTELYKEGGPVFIYIGGEGQEGARRLASGKLFMTYLAERFRAKMFDLEHRYYGFSHPTPDLSSASLQYLSADQALADLAYFIEYLKEAGELLPGQKVAVFGGSYPGNLAAWARLKYPHLVHAAVSSSAPVHAEADYPEYMQVVKNSLDRVAGKWCAANVKLASDRIVELLKTADGVAQVKKIFHIATDLTAKEDIDIFFEILSNPFAGAVQYNRDSAPQSAYNIKYICSFVAGDNLTPDEAMQKLSNLVYGGQTNVPPQDWSYKSQIASYGLTSYQLQDGEYDASRQWLYQTCTEFGYFQTFSGDGTPFPKEYNDLAYAIKLCKDVYGDAYDEAVVNGAIKRSNLVFGDRSPDVNKVIFVNGNIDPWHALGILSDVSDAAPAVMVDGGSHCADMNYPSAMWDTPSVSAAHKKVHQFLLGALYEAPDGRPAY